MLTGIVHPLQGRMERSTYGWAAIPLCMSWKVHVVHFVHNHAGCRDQILGVWACKQGYGVGICKDHRVRVMRRVPWHSREEDEGVVAATVRPKTTRRCGRTG